MSRDLEYNIWSIVNIMVLYILKMLNIDLMFLSQTYTCIYIEKLTKDFGGDR